MKVGSNLKSGKVAIDTQNAHSIVTTKLFDETSNSSEPITKSG